MSFNKNNSKKLAPILEQIDLVTRFKAWSITDIDENKILNAIISFCNTYNFSLPEEKLNELVSFIKWELQKFSGKFDEYNELKKQLKHKKLYAILKEMLLHKEPTQAKLETNTNKSKQTIELEIDKRLETVFSQRNGIKNKDINKSKETIKLEYELGIKLETIEYKIDKELETSLSQRNSAVSKLHKDIKILIESCKDSLESYYILEMSMQFPNYIDMIEIKLETEGHDLISINNENFFTSRTDIESGFHNISKRLNHYQKLLHLGEKSFHDPGGRNQNHFLNDYINAMAIFFEKYFEPITNYKAIDPENGHQIQKSKIFLWCKTCLVSCIEEDRNIAETIKLYQDLPHVVEAFIKKSKLKTKELT